MKQNVLVALLILAVAGAAGASGCGPSRPPKIVIGLDGLSWTFLDPLLKARHSRILRA